MSPEATAMWMVLSQPCRFSQIMES